jgi:hypothetical protein
MIPMTLRQTEFEGGYKRLSMRIPIAIHKSMDESAERNMRSLNAEIMFALRQYSHQDVERLVDTIDKRVQAIRNGQAKDRGAVDAYVEVGIALRQILAGKYEREKG